MIKPLTSLRFFFAFLVFMSHFILFPQDKYPFMYHIFYEGYAGVSFFFVLSGFILAYSYKEKLLDGSVDKKSFYIARLARIYPVHLLTLIIAIPISGFVLGNVSDIGKLFSNIFLLQSHFPYNGVYFSFNAVSWSISNEMFFYLLFPFLVSTHHNLGRWFFFGTVLILSGMLLIPAADQHALFYIQPVVRLFDFILGIILFQIIQKGFVASVVTKRGTLWESIAVLNFVAFYLLSIAVPQVFRYSIWYWVPVSLLILVFYYQDGSLSKILSHRWFVLAGEISFGFYMIHQLVIRYFHMTPSSLKFWKPITDKYHITGGG